MFLAPCPKLVYYVKLLFCHLGSDLQALFCNLRYVAMTTRFTRELAIFFVIMSLVCSYGYIEPFFFVLMEVMLIDVIK